ncbi:MAG: thermosome subunit alpha [Thermoproteota archaeon]|nr:thermosome subunit [Candidatus Brockarchaeota archaeon]
MSVRGSSSPRVIPSIILKEGSRRSCEKEAQLYNLLASEVIFETVRTALGPLSYSKIIVDTFGDTTITGDGATILSELEVEHPAAKLIVDAAKSQNKEVGDGVTTLVVLTHLLFKEADLLMKQGIHPSIILENYKAGMVRVLEALRNELATRVDLKNVDLLRRIALSAIPLSLSNETREKLADISVKAVVKLLEKGVENTRVFDEYLKTEKKSGGTVLDIQLIEGVALDKEIVHPAMPKRIENAKIALLDLPIEVKKTEIDERLKFSDARMIREFLKMEQKMMSDIVDKIAGLGVNVVFVQKGIDDFAQYILAKKGIMALRRVKKSDMEKLALATGAKIVSVIDDLSEDKLGFAGLVEERKIGGEKWTFVEKTPNNAVQTILVRGENDKITDEMERIVKNCISVLRSLVEEPYVVPGGGAAEVFATRKLIEAGMGGKEGLVMEALSRAFEAYVKQIIANAGHDPDEIFTMLRAAHAEGRKTACFDASEGKISDAIEKNILDPLRVKKTAYLSALETAAMLVRIDDIIMAARMKPPKGKEGEEE